MAWWSNIAGTALGYFRLGLSGVRIKDSSGVLAVRDAGDTADAKIQIADGTAANHAISKGQLTPANVSDQANTSTGYFGLPVGTTAERPSAPANGNIRLNEETHQYEGYFGGLWWPLSGFLRYATQKAIFGYGTTGAAVSITNLVSNTGVVATDTTGVGTARSGLAAAGYSIS